MNKNKYMDHVLLSLILLASNSLMLSMRSIDTIPYEELVRKERIETIKENFEDEYFRALWSGEEPPKISVWKAAKDNNLGALMFAIKYDTNIDINAKESNGKTLLYYATINENIDMITFLIKKGADPQIKYNFKTSRPNYMEAPINYAARRGILELATCLTSLKQVDINAKNSVTSTPLWITAHGGNPKTTECLLEKGADPEIRNSSGQTALWAAICSLHKPFLLGSPNQPKKRKAKILKTIKILLRYNATNREKRYEQETPLCYAARKRDWELVKILVDGGADVNATSFSQTALYYATKNNNTEMVRFLIQKGANPQIKYNFIRSKPRYMEAPLNYAARNDKFNLVTCLTSLEQVDINVQNSSNGTPLSIAAYNGRVNLTKHLLKKKADPDIKHNNGTTALWAAIKPYSNTNKIKILQTIELLLQYKADRYSVHEREIPIEYATRTKDLKLKKLLEKYSV